MPIVAPSSRYTLANNNNGDSNSNTETTTITTTTAAETVKKTNEEPGRPSVWRSHPISDNAATQIEWQKLFLTIATVQTDTHTYMFTLAA